MKFVHTALLRIKKQFNYENKIKSYWLYDNVSDFFLKLSKYTSIIHNCDMYFIISMYGNTVNHVERAKILINYFLQNEKTVTKYKNCFRFLHD